MAFKSILILVVDFFCGMTTKSFSFGDVARYSFSFFSRCPFRLFVVNVKILRLDVVSTRDCLLRLHVIVRRHVRCWIYSSASLPSLWAITSILRFVLLCFLGGG